MIIPSFHAGRVARAVTAPSGSDFTAEEFNFNDCLDISRSATATTNTVTMPHSGTLAIEIPLPGGWDGTGYIYKNGVSQTAYDTSNMTPGTSAWFSYTGRYARFDVSIGDQLYFSYTAPVHPYVESFSVNIRNATSVPESFTGTLIDTHNVSKTGCFLTTAVVEYMGGLDNGPELTAMRMLREHYRFVQGYEENIQDYYTNSPLIIKQIEAGVDKAATYSNIYATVKSCESFVMAGEWEQAHNLYMAMYLDLKTRYLGL